MEDVKIILSTSWVALMLTYLLGMCCEYTAATLSLGNRRYENKSGSVVGSCSADGDSGCHGFPLPDVELSCESLGEHHRGYCLSWFQSHWIAWIPFSLRQIPDNCRSWV